MNDGCKQTVDNGQGHYARHIQDVCKSGEWGGQRRVGVECRGKSIDRRVCAMRPRTHFFMGNQDDSPAQTRQQTLTSFECIYVHISELIFSQYTNLF